MLFEEMKDLLESEITVEEMDVDSISESVSDYILAECFEGLNEAEVQEFINDPEFKALAEAMKFKNKSIMRLSKKDDLERRENIMIVQIAKETNDPLAKLLAKTIRTKKKIMAKLRQKHGNKARKRSLIAQKEYIKNSKTINKIKNKITGKR